jgi:hypothetical protein
MSEEKDGCLFLEQRRHVGGVIVRATDAHAVCSTREAAHIVRGW